MNTHTLVFGTYNNWQMAYVVDGRNAIAGYFDSLDRPNLQGAIATAKFTTYKNVHQSIELPDGETGFIETRTPMNSGDMAVVRVSGYVLSPKAWPAKLLADQPPATSVQWHDAATSVIERAMANYDIQPANMRQDDDAAVDFMVRHNGREELKDNASLIIEQTQALTAIDLNTGSLQGVSNCIAVFGPAVARALQTYSAGGAIVVDAGFLGGSARQGLAEKIEKEMQADPLNPKLVSITKGGLLKTPRPRWAPSRMKIPL